MQRRTITAWMLALALAAGCSKKETPADQQGSAEQGEHEHGDHPDRADRRARLEAARAKLDTNHDGKLSPDELSKADQPFLHFDDPASIDTDHDGDITVDELSAALKARRGQWHKDHGGGSAGGSAEGSGSGS
jgi:hypothetical protein